MENFTDLMNVIQLALSLKEIFRIAIASRLPGKI
jgi:hypothetical protein